VALLHARLNIARLNAARLNYVGPAGPTNIFLKIGGVWTNVTAYARIAEATVTQALNEVIDTATITFSGAIPYALKGTPIVFANNIGGWYYAGHITAVRTIYEGRAANVAYVCECLDWTWLLSARTVTARYTGLVATSIVYYLLFDYGPGGFPLNTAGVTTDPVLDEITFTNENLPQAISRTCERAGLYWYVGTDKSVYVFNSAAIPSAGTIDQTRARQAVKLAKHDDAAAVVTRVHARGGGAAAASDAAVGQTTLPIADAAWYLAAGGLVECGPQRLSYTGVVGASEGGSTLGTIQAPSNVAGSPWGYLSVIPDVDPGQPNPMAPGTYWIAFTNLTAGGESLATAFQMTLEAPNISFTVFPTTAPADPKITRFNLYATREPGQGIEHLRSSSDPAVTPKGFPYTAPFLKIRRFDGSYAGGPPTINTAGETSLTIPAGSTVLALEDLAPFPTSGWAEAPGGQLLRYTGKSAASGPGSLTGIPASGIGAITAPVRSGTIRSIPHLTGIPASGAGAIVYPIKSGDQVLVCVVREDAAAIAALAAATGGDGIRIEFLTDGRLALPELTARADALLTMRKQSLVTVTFETRDAAVTVGKTITFNTTAPPIVGTFLIQRVQLSQFPGHGAVATPPLRVVEASSRRYTFEDLVQQIKLLGRIN
jgi:hypothetical protein